MWMGLNLMHRGLCRRIRDFRFKQNKIKLEE